MADYLRTFVHSMRFGTVTAPSPAGNLAQVKREDIERSDFPAARRGYDRKAVDAHLSKLAAEIERLEGQAAKPATSLADAAGERVSSVIAAAETKASEIEQDADREADESRSAAQAEAQALVESAEQSVTGLITEAEELRKRVRSLGDGLGSATGVKAETQPAVVPEPTPPEREIDPTPVIVPEPSPEPVPEPSPDPVREPSPNPAPEPAPSPMPEPSPLPQPSAPEAPAAEQNGNTAGARLVAMKMALDGASRDDVKKHLDSSFGLSSADELLDDVFARASR